VLRWSGLPAVLKVLTAMVLGADTVTYDLRFSDEFVASYLIGPLVALNFLGAHGLAPLLERHLARWRKPIGFVAQSTFALYLLHYPMLRFAEAAFGYDIHDPLQVLAVFAGVVGSCVVIGPAIERTKGAWKALLTGKLVRSRLSPQGLSQ
jgi:peptidoglycan/LPS O-acetylase OafA/YrhL